MKIKSGGGITSNKLVTSTAYKTEPKPKAANVEGIGQVGLSHQFKPKEIFNGPGYSPGKMPATGVPGKYNAAKQGPGSQRTVHPSGSQSQYGPVAQGSVNRSPDPPATAPGRDILGMYGPEKRR
jgi:hypothetical protein